MNTLKYVQSFVPSFPVFTKTSESREQTDVSDSESPDVENPEDDANSQPIMDLLKTLDDYIPQPERDLDKDFMI